MKILISENAEKELGGMEPSLRELFFRHMEKMLTTPPRRHMRFGMPFSVENVTRQARMVYHIEKETLYIIHCFKSHKEYEKWYKSFK